MNVFFQDLESNILNCDQMGFQLLLALVVMQTQSVSLI